MSEKVVSTDALIIQKQQVGYAVANRALVLTQVNQTLSQWHNGRLLVGQPIVVVFPELLGMEGALQHLLAGEIEDIHIPQIATTFVDAAQEKYFDLQVEVWDEQLLITLVDVTQQTVQAQGLQQTRNELYLLTNQLNKVNAQLDYLLKRFVPEKVAQQLIDEGRLPDPGGERRCEATILFADMRKFSAFSEVTEPEETVRVLNAYFTVMAKAIWAYGGSIVQIVGDMIMAAFNVVEAQPDHAWRGLQAAWDVRARLTALLASDEALTSDEAEDLPYLKFGIGVSSGTVTVGYLGAKNRYRYAVVGDTTNVAFHLCSRAQEDEIIFDETTKAQLMAPVEARLLGEAKLKGRRQPVTMYQLLALA